jgi:hypothetical protein
MYTATQRKFKDIETNLLFTLYENSTTKSFKLIFEDNKNNNDPANGTEVNGFYLTSFEMHIKLNGNKIVKLKPGTFYNLKEGETITHKKIIGYNSKFIKA